MKTTRLDTGWKEEMEALMAKTLANWSNTGRDKKSKGLNCQLSLLNGAKKEAR